MPLTEDYRKHVPQKCKLLVYVFCVYETEVSML